MRGDFTGSLGKSQSIRKTFGAGTQYRAVCYDETQKPMLVTAEALEQFERIETPGEYCEAIQSTRSEAEEKRVRMIKPMLEDTNCLIDAAYRIDVAKKIAKQENLTVRGICNLYYRFLATGTVPFRRKSSAG